MPEATPVIRGQGQRQLPETQSGLSVPGDWPQGEGL